ncbi:MAG: dolichyl-phosphate beta-glucosyltransferase [bacterium]
MIYLSVVIPCFNEENRISQTLSKITDYLKNRGFNYEIIVVDDGSTDKTISCLRDFENIVVLKNEKNIGKGYSVRRGVMEAKGEYILFSDADLSTPIEEVERLLEEIKENDIVIGSRASLESKILIRQPWWRERMGKIFNIFVRLFVIKGFKDTQCGFKLFKGGVAKRIFELGRINRFAFDVEILFLAKKFGYKIKEVGVCWRNSFASKVSPITSSLNMAFSLFLIRLNDLIGLYEKIIPKQMGNGK